MIQAMQVFPHQLGHLEMVQIEAALQGEERLAHVFLQAGRGRAQIFRIFGSCQGICVTQVHDDGKERYLFVWLLAGRRLALHLRQLWEMLEQVAVSQKCYRVVARPTGQLANIYKWRLGFEDHPVGVCKEVDRGRRRDEDN